MASSLHTATQLLHDAIETLKDTLAPGQECHALHASVESVLIPSKARPIKNAFWEGLHDIGGVVAAAYEDKKVKAYRILPPKHSTVLVGALPFPTQQRALLQSLLNQLVIYYMLKLNHPKRRSKRGETSSSYFEFGHFSVITFLHRSEFARLISAPAPDGTPRDFAEGIDFFTAPHRHFSHLFQTLFDVKLPAGLEPFPPAAFEPHVPSTSVAAYASKFDAIGLDSESVYAVQLEPKLEVSLPGDLVIPFSPTFPTDDEQLHLRQSIALFAAWMTASAKLGTTKLAEPTLKNLLGEKLPTTRLRKAKIGPTDRVRNVTPAQFGQLFALIHAASCGGSLPPDLVQQLESFKNGLHRTADEKFVD
uniref:EST1_DNA_bind domain-containing protein n=1 Tax=Panagrellus redivivus TaxID=6233 RepID=A0A7E4W9Z8_PANRE